MNAHATLRLRYDGTTGNVHLTVRRTIGRGKARKRITVPLDRIPRAHLRDLCDLFHDLADGLDPVDRGGGRASASPEANPHPTFSGSSGSLPGEHPHRAGAGEERARG